MKKYYKNNLQVVKPKQIIYNNQTYLNPKDEILLNLGYEIKEANIQLPTINKKYIKIGERLLKEGKQTEIINKFLPFIKQEFDNQKNSINKKEKFKQILNSKKILPLNNN